MFFEMRKYLLAYSAVSILTVRSKVWYRGMTENMALAVKSVARRNVRRVWKELHPSAFLRYNSFFLIDVYHFYVPSFLYLSVSTLEMARYEFVGSEK
jgi:hypothetical protein